MASKATISLISLFSVGWAFCACAQPLVHSTANVAPSAGEASVQRSALWTAVHSLYRESHSEPASASRRLSPNERLELREQIRRAAAGELQAEPVSEHLPPRAQVLQAGQ